MFDFQPPLRYKGFLDSLKLLVAGGAGGMGAPKYGGFGGRGGSVILQTKPGVTLNNIVDKFRRCEIRAESGGNSCSTQILGKNGADKIVQVPAGLTVIDQNQQILGEMNERNMKLMVAKGGVGGCPETGYSGTGGQKQVIQLDLKLYADVGLIGCTNAGKSTLLNAITTAKPHVSSKIFSTKKPYIGNMIFEDLRQISVIDLPSLKEGAHKNEGLGNRFLRHCERCQLLICIVDIRGFKSNRERRSCLETVILLNKELELYRECLLDKPAFLLVNKMDVTGAWDIFKEIEKSLHKLTDAFNDVPIELRPHRPMKFDQVIPISVKRDSDEVMKLKNTIRNYLDLYAEEKLVDAEQNLIKDLQKQLVEMAPIYA